MTVSLDEGGSAALQARFAAALATLRPHGCLWVAFSGGADSTALLYLASRHGGLGERLRAVHVNHGLHPDAPRWARHCEAVAAALGVAVEVQAVQVDVGLGEGPEAAARRARYAVFAGLLRAGEVLLTAHHARDQAETVLLRLLRGAGVRGLGAMAPVGPLAAGRIARPLLDEQPATLRACLRSAGIAWVEDPANAEPGFDRVFLRQRILPLLRERWPALDRGLGRSAALHRETTALVEHLVCGATDDEHRAAPVAPVSGTASLDCAVLGALPPAVAAEYLRGWLRAQGTVMPSRARTAEILRQMLGARDDAQPAVAWGEHCLRRYRARLYLGPAHLAAPPPARSWQGGGSYVYTDGVLLARPVVGAGVAVRCLRGAEVTLAPRAGAERCTVGAGRRASLKHLMQGWGLPPWQRDRLPLLFIDGQLAVVPGHLTCTPYRARDGEPGWWLRWRDGPPGSGPGVRP